MPTADSGAPEPETYGDSPGWSDRQIAVTPAPSVNADAHAESSPADAETAPSAAEPSPETGSQEGTAPSTPPAPEKKWHEPPQQRWEELRQQRLQAEERAAKAEQLAQLALQKLQTPTAPTPEIDPYVGMDAQTAEFYRNLDKRIEVKAAALADAKVQGVLQALDAGRREVVEIKLNQFRQANPDIKPNSPEEQAIAGLVQQGYDLTTAKKLALYDRLEAENRAMKTKQQAIPQKRAANTEASAGIPQTAGLPPKPGDWRTKAGEILDKGGSIKDVFSVVFGEKR